MFKSILSLTMGIFLGWNLHIYFMALEPKRVIEDINNTNVSCIKRVIIEPKYKKIEKKVVVERAINRDLILFKRLLNSNRFYDAMELYIDANESNLIEYQKILKRYFYNSKNREPPKIIDEILYYMDIELKSDDLKPYLSELYGRNGEYLKAIDILYELKDSKEEMSNNLDNSIERYIEILTKNRDFKELISLLTYIINRDSNNQKYIIELANLYYKLDNYDRAIELIEKLDSNSIYSKKGKSILREIANQIEELNGYTTTVPLKRVGSQYSIEIRVDGTNLTLILDTGASHTLIDEDSLPYLNFAKEVLLNTAGGKIMAHTAIVDTLELDNIELKSFRLMVAPFKIDGVDGLLGMDFLKRFNFKIDQNRDLLYLKIKRD